MSISNSLGEYSGVPQLRKVSDGPKKKCSYDSWCREINKQAKVTESKN